LTWVNAVHPGTKQLEPELKPQGGPIRHAVRSSKERRPLSGVVARIYEILTADEDFGDEGE